MGITTAMNTAVTGLETSSFMLNTIGDNIANVNTTAFKSNRVDLENLFAVTLRDAGAPGNPLGGTNPLQVGLGATVGSVQTSFVQGSISPTGSPADLAINGQGFFILQDADGPQFYTRDGAFGLTAGSQELVSRDGLFVQGFAADAAGNVDSTGPLSNLVIPLGTLTQAQATTSVTVEGNLNASSDVASAGAVVTSGVLTTAAGPATAATALTTLVDGNGAALFADGDEVLLSGITKGGFTLPDEQFVVGTDGATVQEFMTYLEEVLAINTDPTLAQNAGLTLDAAGQMVVASNFGEANAIDIDSGDIINTTAGIAPFTFVSTAPAAGQGLSSTLDVFDSLGNAVSARLRLAVESKNELGTTWRFYAESADDTDVSNVLGTGTISFDQNGQFIDATGAELSIDLDGSGAVSPLAFAIDFDAVTSLSESSGSSTFGQKDQDGLPFGVLVDFTITEDGLIEGAFSNANKQTLGQVAVATFVNPNGLNHQPDNNYVATLNSGDPNITAPGQSNAGTLDPGSLELSNVDLAKEFIGLINASTGFSASSRVITTADELSQELLLIAR